MADGQVDLHAYPNNGHISSSSITKKPKRSVNERKEKEKKQFRSQFGLRNYITRKRKVF